MRSTRSRLTLALITTLALAAGCRPEATAPASGAEAPLELRTYVVPEGAQEEAVSIVHELLGRGKDAPRLGSVAAGPGHQVLVTAPASFHAGVADLVERLKKEPPAPPPTVAMEYWMLLGRPAEAPTDPAGFEPALRPVVKALQAAHGPMALALSGRVQVASLAGRHAESVGDTLQVQQRAVPHRGGLLTTLRLAPAGGTELRTEVMLPPDKVVVLGYAGMGGRKVQAAFPDAETATAFYVVRGGVTTFGE
ncbi:MAG: hypothetical protein H6704_03505 [Myxococcales bacterium]|nr:hypothetical protein [Myxococcales bacterium]MCB9535305.1 hypothetical protein [Myxococcales bacterium]